MHILLLLPRETPRQRPRVREAVQPPERRDADRQRRRGPAEGRAPAQVEISLSDVERDQGLDRVTEKQEPRELLQPLLVGEREHTKVAQRLEERYRR